MLAQLAGAAVDLVAGAPRGHRLIGEGVGDDVDGQLGFRPEHHVGGDAERGPAVGVVELFGGQVEPGPDQGVPTSGGIQQCTVFTPLAT